MPAWMRQLDAKKATAYLAASSTRVARPAPVRRPGATAARPQLDADAAGRFVAHGLGMRPPAFTGAAFGAASWSGKPQPQARKHTGGRVGRSSRGRGRGGGGGGLNVLFCEISLLTSKS